MTGVCLLVMVCGLVFAQGQPGKPAFEAASIKPGPPGTMMDLIRSGDIYYRVDDTQANIGGTALLALIMQAYRVPQDQIVAPDWLNQQRFDIHAKLPLGSSKDDVPEMLKTLLAERFKLVVHHDQKVVPVYLLTVAKGGPKFHESAEDDSREIACNGGVHKICHKVTMEDLATNLSMPSRLGGMLANAAWAIDRPVIDMTGLKGAYDFTMDYGLNGRGRSSVALAESTDPGVVSAFDAVKSLGLALEPSKHTYDILVVDHIERVPTEN